MIIENLSIKAVVIGCLVTFLSYQFLWFAAFWLDFVLEGSVWPAPMAPPPEQGTDTGWIVREGSRIAVLLPKITSFALGGFVTAKVAKSHEQLHAVALIIALTLVHLVQMALSHGWSIGGLRLIAFLAVLGIPCALIGARIAARARVSSAAAISKH